MKKLLSFCILITFSSIYLACDYVNPEVAYETKATPTNKKVLLEVFTGVKCVNCPGITKQGLELIKSRGYEKNIILVKVHSTNAFASPMKGSRYDFRTTYAEELFKSYNLSGLPTGVVSSKKVNGSYALASSAWVTEIEKVVNDPNYAPIIIEPEVDYSEVSRKVSLKLDVEASKSVSFAVNVRAYILEDSIIDLQKIPPITVNGQKIEIDSNFVHEHVFRSQLQGRDGDLLFEKLEAKQFSRKSFNVFTFPELWVDKRCSIVVIATNASTGEVIQVEEIKIIE
jgi:thioredoxin-related protein